MPTTDHREPAAPLVLFDIDGTLIRKAGPHHRQALEEAVWRVTGARATTDTIPVQGMLDRDILRIMLANAGVRGARRHMPALIDQAQAIYEQTCPDLRRKVCPGVRKLLAGLARKGGRAALVTGNLSRIGWKKMDRAGLRDHFHLGAFAEEARDRAGLARLALRRARANGWVARNSRISLIGDHPNDVMAARANGIQSIAVATGLSPAAELASYSPDILISDLSELAFEQVLA